MRYDAELIEADFDPDHYTAQLSSPLESDPIQHYLTTGWLAGHNPNDWFETNAYLDANPDVKAANVNPFAHYLRHGRNEGRQLKPLWGYEAATQTEINLIATEFDARFYLRANSDIQEAEIDPLEHYCNTGWREGRLPNAQFNQPRHLSLFPELKQTGENPFHHYLQVRDTDAYKEKLKPRLQGNAAGAGASKHFNPMVLGTLMDHAYYRSQLPGGETPLDVATHYFQSTASKPAAPHPNFCKDFYLQAYPDVSSDQDAFLHYAETGHLEGRAPNRESHARLAAGGAIEWDDDRDLSAAGVISDMVDPVFYEECYGISASDAAGHYAAAGWREGHDPSADFSTSDYLAKHPNVDLVGMNPLLHHIINKDVFANRRSEVEIQQLNDRIIQIDADGVCKNELGRILDLPWPALIAELCTVAETLAKGGQHPLVGELDISLIQRFLDDHNKPMPVTEVVFAKLFQLLGLQRSVADKVADFSKADIGRYVTLENKGLLDAAISDDRPVMLIGSHAGPAWLALAFLSHLGVGITNVGSRPLQLRMAESYTHISSSNMFPAAVVKACDDTLAQANSVLHIFPDVWTGKGRTLPFLGRDHHIAEGFSFLAHKHRPILLTYSAYIDMTGTVHIKIDNALGDVPKNKSLSEVNELLLPRYRDCLEGFWLNARGSISDPYLDTYYNRPALDTSLQGG